MNRRSVIKGGAVAAGLASTPAIMGVAAGHVTTVFDSRQAKGLAFAVASGGRKIDLALEHDSMWRRLRSELPRGRVEGLTSWTDYVTARGLLEERGLRVQHEAKAGRLFRWTMV